MMYDDIHRDTVIADVLGRRPATALVFVRRAMACVGCAMATFDTVSDAARSYGLQPETLLAELRSADEECS